MSGESPITAGYIPDLPRNMTVGKDGALNYDLQLGLSQLYQALQQLVSNQGISLPPLTTTQQTNITTLYGSLIGKQLPQNVPNLAGTLARDATTSNPIVFIMTFDPATLFVLATPGWHTINYT